MIVGMLFLSSNPIGMGHPSQWSTSGDSCVYWHYETLAQTLALNLAASFGDYEYLTGRKSFLFGDTWAKGVLNLKSIFVWRCDFLLLLMGLKNTLYWYWSDIPQSFINVLGFPCIFIFSTVCATTAKVCQIRIPVGLHQFQVKNLLVDIINGILN